MTALAAARGAVLERHGWDLTEARPRRAPRACGSLPARSVTSRSTVPFGCSGSGEPGDARPGGRPGSRAHRCAARRDRDGRGADDRLRAGGRGQHRSLRGLPRDRGSLRGARLPGCTSTAPSGCGQRRAGAFAISPPASSEPTPGRRTATSGSTSPMTAASRSVRIPPRIVRPCARRRLPPQVDESKRARADGLHARVLAPGPRGARRTRRLRSLGRCGIAELVERCCDAAAALASGLARIPGCTILNEVVLNQVLVRFDADERTTASARSVPGGRRGMDERHRLGGQPAIRFSVSSWRTTPDDVERSIAAFARAAAS